MSERITGRIKWYDPERRFGFVIPLLGGEDVFLHHSEASAIAERLQPNVQVIFTPKRNGRKGVMAVNVTLPGARDEQRHAG